ncbi:DUF3006 domain-containing protein [Irregularibacter muris]|uniref:DUF3006 domain-containing protein n=1 Tax=Irregularibacter muris TaxID=1796619 RepID=A0AAE3HFN0_9FIRM|nr:DUF3006 domain-containing protein [Irregularibacter muris]MCR1899725.1 DUF3006 domain-containing protein [Irregularibacter muris]
MKVIIDGFEGNFAVVELENKVLVNMPKELIPQGAKEGDILDIHIDQEETQRRKKKIKRLMEDLWE